MWRESHLRARAEAVCGLYVHVPFCAVRCTYCDFSTGHLTQAGVERYLVALEREMALRGPASAGTRFTSVFFGGGTPSALSAKAFSRLWGTLARHFDIAPHAEITLEANPESVNDPRLEAWAEAGVNRLSFGAQTFDPAELVTLGRVHDASRPGEAVRRARAYGVRRLSIDLMFGFPGHSEVAWRRTLERTLELDLEHVSAYCFIPESGTPLGDAVEAGRAVLPGETEQAESYARLVATLATRDFGCYETSNFCRPGGEARHNLVYWLRRPYVGLGPSAHGLMRGVHHGNTYDRNEWARALDRGECPEDETESETPASRAREIMMLGLRLSCGLHRADYAEHDWDGLVRQYGGAFDRALAQGRLERCASGLRIPAEHRFVADDVIAWIDAAAEPGRFDFATAGSIIHS